MFHADDFLTSAQVSEFQIFYLIPFGAVSRKRGLDVCFGIVNLVRVSPTGLKGIQQTRRKRPNSLVNILTVRNLILPRHDLHLNIRQSRLLRRQQSLHRRNLDQRIRRLIIPAIPNAIRDQSRKICHVPRVPCFSHNNYKGSIFVYRGQKKMLKAVVGG